MAAELSQRRSSKAGTDGGSLSPTAGSNPLLWQAAPLTGRSRKLCPAGGPADCVVGGEVLFGWSGAHILLEWDFLP